MLAMNPNKLNILYSVLMKPSDPLTIFRPFINDLKVSKTSENFFASRTYNDASNLYELVALEIAENNALFPANSHPDVVKYGTKIRTCEKFDTCTVYLNV